MNGHSSQNGTSSQNVHSAQNGRQNGHSVNGHAPGEPAPMSKQEEELLNLTLQLRDKKDQDKKYARFHGDMLIGNPIEQKVGLWGDFKRILSKPNVWPAVGRTVDGLVTGTGLDGQSAATIGGNLSDYSVARNNLINSQVKDKYDKMLHPPLTYLGDAFQYRTADGKFNSAINPHLGQAGAPYAKTVPSKTAPLGALPDPADLFDKLMARQEGGRDSQSGLSAMLIYHATIIIHDIFRTNDNDKNISDSSSYLDLSPLYGYTNEMQRKIRDDKYKLGLLKPDTFAEDRLLRQPPGVCIMLVMYNRYHNYAARQLLRINENNRFRVPKMYEKTQLVSLIYQVIAQYDQNGEKKLPPALEAKCKEYEKVWRKVRAERPADPPSAPEQLPDEAPEEKKNREDAEAKKKAAEDAITAFEARDLYQGLVTLTKELEKVISNKADEISAKSEELGKEFKEQCEKFKEAWEAAWNKQDDDLFNTARLITCGMYIQISVHDYLRALMGFHQFDTNFTLDPRADFDQKKTSRGIGNQVTVEFNLLYRFHCAISMKDEAYTEEYMERVIGLKDPKNTSLPAFLMAMKKLGEDGARDLKRNKVNEPWNVTFGIPDPKPVPTAGDGSGNSSDSGISLNRAATDASKATDAKDKPKSKNFTRNAITNLFDDQQMLDELTKAMDDPISNFGPRNVPKCLKSVEIMGILQARKWECGTLNDFRDFFSLPRHASFESVTKNVEIQNALRDLYEHPDKIELYPGIFCESDEKMGLDPGPSESSSALWSAIFSDAITLVRSDRFYTVDWNTNSLTSWGMKEVTPNNEILKSSVFHRLLQRAFPGWFPSNTIRFFHPFYTTKQNGAYAEAQGYGDWFKETVGKPKNKAVVAAPVCKPEKPWYLDQYDDICIVLKGDNSDQFTNPAYYYQANLPPVVRDVLKPDKEKEKKLPKSSVKIDNYVRDSEEELKQYLDELMKEMIKRESISMTNSTFQVDATRDFAIPVVTHYVAEFLGFGDKLCKDPSQSKGLYSENQIYQHITNCQIFLTYNADETKWLQRREAFKASMKALIELTQKGTIWEANQWDITIALFGKKKTNAMHDLGVFVAKEVLAYEKDQNKAAAILLLICLDFAYNAVVSFTATLDGFMKDLYAAADGRPHLKLGLRKFARKDTEQPLWVQAIDDVFGSRADSALHFEQLVQEMAHNTVKQPIIRKALKDGDYTFKGVNDGKTVHIKEGQAIILDVRVQKSRRKTKGNS
uniref:Psi-producing oxygenase A n=1 Tax=Fusarium oxysporum (strain Fo5176) TaxID=660025 RepID=A0A0D2YHS7_FUSOF